MNTVPTGGRSPTFRPTYSPEDVAHMGKKSWLIVNELVYDLSKFDHPGMARQEHIRRIMVDLQTRFLMNVPKDVVGSMNRVMVEVEKAYWMYCDTPQYCQQGGKMNFSQFTANFFRYSTALKSHASNTQNIITEYRRYLQRVPVYGCMIFNASLTKILCIRQVDSWVFPRGKRDEGESEMESALREVVEEISMDVSSFVSPTEYLESTIKQKCIRLYIAVGADDKIPLRFKRSFEVQECKWFDVRSMPHSTHINVFMRLLYAFMHARMRSCPPELTQMMIRTPQQTLSRAALYLKHGPALLHALQARFGSNLSTDLSTVAMPASVVPKEYSYEDDDDYFFGGGYTGVNSWEHRKARRIVDYTEDTVQLRTPVTGVCVSGLQQYLSRPAVEAGAEAGMQRYVDVTDILLTGSSNSNSNGSNSESPYGNETNSNCTRGDRGSGMAALSTGTRPQQHTRDAAKAGTAKRSKPRSAPGAGGAAVKASQGRASDAGSGSGGLLDVTAVLLGAAQPQTQPQTQPMVAAAAPPPHTPHAPTIPAASVAPAAGTIVPHPTDAGGPPPTPDPAELARQQQLHHRMLLQQQLQHSNMTPEDFMRLPQDQQLQLHQRIQQQLLEYHHRQQQQAAVALPQDQQVLLRTQQQQEIHNLQLFQQTQLQQLQHAMQHSTHASAAATTNTTATTNAGTLEASTAPVSACSPPAPTPPASASSATPAVSAISAKLLRLKQTALKLGKPPTTALASTTQPSAACTTTTTTPAGSTQPIVTAAHSATQPPQADVQAPATVMQSISPVQTLASAPAAAVQVQTTQHVAQLAPLPAHTHTLVSVAAPAAAPPASLLPADPAAHALPASADTTMLAKSPELDPSSCPALRTPSAASPPSTTAQSPAPPAPLSTPSPNTAPTPTVASVVLERSTSAPAASPARLQRPSIPLPPLPPAPSPAPASPRPPPSAVAPTASAATCISASALPTPIAAPVVCVVSAAPAVSPVPEPCQAPHSLCARCVRCAEPPVSTQEPIALTPNQHAVSPSAPASDPHPATATATATALPVAPMSAAPGPAAVGVQSAVAGVSSTTPITAPSAFALHTASHTGPHTAALTPLLRSPTPSVPGPTAALALSADSHHAPAHTHTDGGIAQSVSLALSPDASPINANPSANILAQLFPENTVQNIPEIPNSEISGFSELVRVSPDHPHKKADPLRSPPTTVPSLPLAHPPLSAASAAHALSSPSASALPSPASIAASPAAAATCASPSPSLSANTDISAASLPSNLLHTLLYTASAPMPIPAQAPARLPTTSSLPHPVPRAHTHTHTHTHAHVVASLPASPSPSSTCPGPQDAYYGSLDEERARGWSTVAMFRANERLVDTSRLQHTDPHRTTVLEFCPEKPSSERHFSEKRKSWHSEGGDSRRKHPHPHSHPSSHAHTHDRKHPDRALIDDALLDVSPVPSVTAPPPPPSAACIQKPVPLSGLLAELRTRPEPPRSSIASSSLPDTRASTLATARQASPPASELGYSAPVQVPAAGPPAPAASVTLFPLALLQASAPQPPVQPSVQPVHIAASALGQSHAPGTIGNLSSAATSVSAPTSPLPVVPLHSVPPLDASISAISAAPPLSVLPEHTTPSSLPAAPLPLAPMATSTSASAPVAASSAAVPPSLLSTAAAQAVHIATPTPTPTLKSSISVHPVSVPASSTPPTVPAATAKPVDSVQSKLLRLKALTKMSR